MRFDRVCVTCKKQFKTKNVNGNICYWCALREITSGRAPEEGDFNTARLTSGEMTVQEEKWLMKELLAVDRAAHACDRCNQIRCICDLIDEPVDWYDRECDRCGLPVEICEC